MVIVEHVSSLEVPEILGKFSLNKTKNLVKVHYLIIHIHKSKD